VTVVSINGTGPVSRPNGTAVTSPTGGRYVWEHGSTNVTVRYRVAPPHGEIVLGEAACLDFRTPSGNATQYKCVQGDTHAGSQSATFRLSSWPLNGSTPYADPSVVITRTNTSTRSVIARRNLSLVPITKGGDLDKDGLSNAAEVSHGTSLTNADTDGDGLTDGAEVHTYHTNPTRVDTDGDGIPDGLEVALGTNPNNPLDGYLIIGGGALLIVAAGAVVLTRMANFERGGLGRLAPRSDGGTAAASVDGAESPGPADPAESDAAVEAAREAPATDQDRVVRLVEDAGGRIKQSRIVEETEWSKAKVSRLLSSMEDNGRITKIRIGRENLICIDDEAATSGRE